MTNIGLLHEISATFINICINLMRVYQKHAQMLCKIDRKDAGPDLPWKRWFFRNLVEAQVAEDHFPFEQVKRCSPKHYSLYSF